MLKYFGVRPYVGEVSELLNRFAGLAHPPSPLPAPEPTHGKDLGESMKRQQNSGHDAGLFNLGLEATTADYIEQSGRSVTLYFTNQSRAELFKTEWLKCCEGEA